MGAPQAHEGLFPVRGRRGLIHYDSNDARRTSERNSRGTFIAMSRLGYRSGATGRVVNWPAMVPNSRAVAATLPPMT